MSGWNNPPPPGTEALAEDEDELSSTSSKVKNTFGEEPNKVRSIDRIDPYLKNPEYIEYERQNRSRDHSRYRRRSHSKSKRRRRSLSRSRDRHRRSRSRSRGRRHHRRRSYSRSPSSGRHRYSRSKREKRHKRSRSRRYSRSHSHSPNRRGHHRRSRTRSSRSRDDIRSESDKEDPMNTSGDVDEDDEPATKENAFKNDGSFLELFKKMQEEQQKAADAAKEQAGSSDVTNVLPIIKRRGGRVLKTGMVEKSKVLDEGLPGDGLDAWSVYMKEVKRYKEACCDDDSKTRPLVK